MRWNAILLAAAIAAAPMAARATEPVSVMFVGSFHMSNPGHDYHNLKADDMLAPIRQAEIARITDALARFKPTVVALEQNPEYEIEKRYAIYLAGTLKPSANEVVQLGFRLAKTAGLKTVRGIDADGDFPYPPVETYAKAHGQSAILDAANADIQSSVDMMGAKLAAGSVGGVLRFLNDPAQVAHDQEFYRTMLRIGGGATQPGADLLTAWYHRNFLICANLVQLAKPGDHVVIFFGSGHAFLLRACVSEMPGYKLVEANDYLVR